MPDRNKIIGDCCWYRHISGTARQYQPNKLSSFLFFVIYRVLKQQFVRAHYLVPNPPGLQLHLLGRHGEEGGHAQRHPGRHRVGVQPEGDPGDDDQHTAGNVDCQQVVGELPFKGEVHREAAVLAWGQCHVSISSSIRRFVITGEGLY